MAKIEYVNNHFFKMLSKYKGTGCSESESEGGQKCRSCIQTFPLLTQREGMKMNSSTSLSFTLFPFHFPFSTPKAKMKVKVETVW